MKNLQRVLASVMAVAMLATNVTVGYTATDSEADLAAKRLQSVGVLKGDDKGNLNLDQTVTRAEAATIMVRILGQEKSAKYSVGMSSFSDMAGHWAAGAVEVAKNNNLIKGFADGTFRPDEKVTYAQMATMMVRALGAGEAVEARGNWPVNVMAFASANDLTDDVSASMNAPMVRGQVAILTDNTLDAPLWEVSGYNTDGSIEISEVEKDEDGNQETLFTEKLDLKKYEEYEVTKKVTVDDEDYKFEASFDENEDGDFTDAKDVEDKKFTFAEGAEQDLVVGQLVDIWTNDDNDVVMVQVAEESDEKVVTFEDITDIDVSDKEIEVDGDEYDFITNVPVSVNGDDSKDIDYLNNEDKEFEGTLVLNEDGDVKAINAVEYDKFVIVDEVDFDEDDNTYDFDENTDDTKDGDDLTVDLDDTAVVMAGTKSDIADIEEGDFLLYAENTTSGEKTTYIKVVDVKVVEGEVESTSKDEYEVDGEDYTEYGNFSNVSVKVEDEVKLFVDGENRILAYDKLVNGGAAGDYAVITEFYVYQDVEEKENVAKIVLFDLESGEYTSKMEFDAEETDDEGEVFTGVDFYASDSAVEEVRPDGNLLEEDENDITTKNSAVANADYEDFVGKVVEYEVKSGKVVLYKVETDEIVEETDKNTDNVELDVDKEKFTLGTANYYVDADDVKVYQATELDGRELKIEKLNYSDLKDSEGSKTEMVSMVSFDDDKEVADFVYFPLKDMANDTKVTLRKSNDDYAGIVTNVRELSGDEYKVTVLTKDGEVNFYANEDESDKMSLNDDGRFVGQFVTFSMDENEYATKENVDFKVLTDLVKRKFVEVSDRGEVELATSNTATTKIDAYKDLFFVNAEITDVKTITIEEKAATGTIALATLETGDKVTAGDVTFTSADGTETLAEIATALTTGNTKVTVAADGKVTAKTAGVAGNAITLTQPTGDGFTLTGMTGGVDEVSTMSLKVEDVESADESDIEDIDTDDKTGSVFDDYAKADNVYYYLVDVDDDGDLDETGSDSAIAVIMFDQNGEEAETK